MLDPGVRPGYMQDGNLPFQKRGQVGEQKSVPPKGRPANPGKLSARELIQATETLTHRDFEILSYLYENGVATFEQLRSQFFKSDCSSWTRLKTLKKGGWIESKRASEVRTFNKVVKPQEGLGPSKDLHKRKIYHLGERLRSKNRKNDFFIEPKMWKHQVQTGNIRILFRKLFPSALILNDPEVRRNWQSYQSSPIQEPVPDLLVKEHALKIAIEIERNAKTEMTYYSRFLLYKNSSYSHVIYFCEGERVFERLVREAAWVSKIGVAHLLAAEKIYQKGSHYQSLHEFLGLPEMRQYV